MRKTDRWQRRHVSIATVAVLGLLLSPWRVWAQTAPYLFDLLKRRCAHLSNMSQGIPQSRLRINCLRS